MRFPKGSKTIKDPVHGYIRITPDELPFVDSLPVQRLRRIKQLPGSEFVYPGAMNTRFEHSLGVMHLAGMMAERISERDDVIKVRLAGLLHDVGHGPFSHTFEPIVKDALGVTHEELSAVIVEKSEIADLINLIGFSPKEISELILGRHASKELSRIMNSSVDADKMDYTVRDSYHTGAGYSVDIHRIAINSMSFGGDLVINWRALEAVETLLMARLLSFRTIYYHKTSRAVQIMLEMGMRSVQDRLPLGRDILEDPTPFLELDDYTLWEIMRRDPRSKEIVESLKRRNILKLVIEWTLEGNSKIDPDHLRDKVAELSSTDPADVIVDYPKVEFIKAGGDLPMFWRDGQLIDPTELSPVLRRLKDMAPSFVRIYTWPSMRKKIREAVSGRDLSDLI